MIRQRTRGLENTLLICQALVVVLALWTSMLVAFHFFTDASPLHFDRYPLYGAVLILGLFMEAISRDPERKTFNLFRLNIFDQHQLTVRQTVFVAGTLFLFLAAAKDAFISRTVMAIMIPLLYFALFGSNWFLPRFLARRVFGNNRIERALLIGSGHEAPRLQSWLREKADFGFRTVGIVSSEMHSDTRGLPWLGERRDLGKILADYRITQVILLEFPASPEDHEQLVEILENHGARLLILSNLEEKLRHRAVHFEDSGLEFIAPRAEPLEDPLNRALKRVMDLMLAIPVVVLVLPVLSVFFLLVHRLQSPGPLFFRQVRAGIQNRKFAILKFRTMHVSDIDENLQATRGDARVFPAGHWLRRMSLDEIPQFWNVIVGEMSVCGPRPHLLDHNVEFARKMRRYHLRTFVKPGITGLAQVRGFRGEIQSVADIEQRLESDIQYFENWRLSLDLAIVFRTALQVLLFAGVRLIRGREDDHKSETSAAPLSVEGRSHSGEAAYVCEHARRNFRQILGVRFFVGTAEEAVTLGMKGGLVVAPSAPVLLKLEIDRIHRAAVQGSALAITDSGLMVLLWQLLTGEKINRVSGLEYLRLLLDQPQLRVAGATFWVMPSHAAMAHNLAWLQQQGFAVSPDDCYIAPDYSKSVDGRVVDPDLTQLLSIRRPLHVIMAIGGGVQEKLGAELLSKLAFRPAVHCTGAAIGFLSGEQAGIPMWADRCRLGWLFRCLHEPAKFLPRYWDARRLLSLMLYYHGRLPDNGPPMTRVSGAVESLANARPGS